MSTDDDTNIMTDQTADPRKVTILSPYGSLTVELQSATDGIAYTDESQTLTVHGIAYKLRLRFILREDGEVGYASGNYRPVRRASGDAEPTNKAYRLITDIALAEAAKLFADPAQREAARVSEVSEMRDSIRSDIVAMDLALAEAHAQAIECQELLLPGATYCGEHPQYRPEDSCIRPRGHKGACLSRNAARRARKA